MNKLFNNVMRSASNAVTKVKGYKYTPKVLMFVGITTIVASGVYACKQTLKLEERIDDAKAEIDHIKELKEDGEYVVNEETGETAEYTDKLYRKDIAIRSLENSKLVLVKSKTEAMQLCNAYAPEHLIIATDDYAQFLIVHSFRLSIVRNRKRPARPGAAGPLRSRAFPSAAPPCASPCRCGARRCG